MKLLVATTSADKLREIRLVLAGLLGATRGAAMLAFSLFGGALADRFDRRRLLMVSQSLGLAVSAVLAVVLLTTPGSTTMTMVLFLLLVFVLLAGGAAVPHYRAHLDLLRIHRRRAGARRCGWPRRGARGGGGAGALRARAGRGRGCAPAPRRRPGSRRSRTS